MCFADLFVLVSDKNNTVFKVADVFRGGVHNTKYALYNPAGKQILFMWGTDAIHNTPKWVMNYVVVDYQIQDLTQKQMLVLFSVISYKYRQIEKQSKNQKIR
jgi:hypothetical protein